MKKVILLFIILFSVICFSCEKKITAPHLRNVSINISDHILPGYFVTAISFDSKGTAWIGTFKQGLIKYDGTATCYNSNNSTLPDSVDIWDVAVDKNDVVWIGSGSGLIKYDHKDFTVYNTFNSPLAENVVWSIAVDNNNILWFASSRALGGGLMKLDGEQWTLYSPENSELPFPGVRDVIVDKSNNTWITVNEHVNDVCIMQIAGDSWILFDKEDFGFELYFVEYLAVDGENNLYASIDYKASSSHDMTRPNIIQYDGKTWTINNPVDEEGGSLGYVRKISVDLFGNVWASLYRREGIVLAVYNGTQWIYNSSDFPISSIFEIVINKKNTVWPGTGDGIYIMEQ